MSSNGKRGSSVVFLPFLIIALLFSLTTAQNSCSEDSDCARGFYCCEGEGYYIRKNTKCDVNCLDHPCTYDTDCAPGEHCRGADNVCQLKPSDGKCDNDTDCVSGEYCCQKTGPDDNSCAINCIYDSCNVDSNCAPDECCHDNICRTATCSETSVAGWIVAIIVIGILITIGIPSIIIICCFCGAAVAWRQGRTRRGVVVTNQAGSTPGTQVINMQSIQQQPYPPTQPYPPQHYPPAQAYPPQHYPPAQPYPQGAPPQYQPPPVEGAAPQTYPPQYQMVSQGPPPPEKT